MKQPLVEKVFSKIDRDEVTQLVMSLVDIPSPPGRELEVAEFILGWLKKNGLETSRQDFEPGRLNAIGTLKGAGKGLSLMFNGHLDTTHPGTPEDLESAGEGIASLFPKAFIEEDVIYGLGSYNCKGPVAAALITLKALKETGVKLNGDVLVAAVCGEIGRAPVGKYQGPAYHGHGYGTRYLLTHGILPDLAVVVEPSFHQLVWTLPGVLYLKVTTYGESVYIPFIDRDKWDKEKTNCIRNTIKMLETIEDWAVAYDGRNRYQSAGGPVTAKVNIGAIEAGQSYQPNRSLASCSAYVDVRVIPTRELRDVRRELEDTLEQAGVEATVEVYRSQKGYEGHGNEDLVKAIRAAYREVYHADPPKTETRQASMWNDVNIFNELGIPTVKFGLAPVSVVALSAKSGGISREGVSVDEYVNMARIYALTAMRMHGLW
ncbi:MAG: M20/M25/M40 family metallo-hydrolase [Chloroflexota bacterium]